MNEHQQSLEAIKDIKRMMERSSRFISLSGWSGISAGICALVGAWLAHRAVIDWNTSGSGMAYPTVKDIFIRLLLIGGGTFISALLLALLFTAAKSKKNGLPLWGPTTARLLWNLAIPLVAGAVFLFRMIQIEQYQLLAAGCLLFYGLALINASKYTLGEIRYLGFGQILLATINLWITGYDLYFWATGFGIFHIIYGIIMWWKYER